MAYHGPGKFDPAVGLVKPATPPASRPSRRSSASGCATWPRRTRAWSASRRRCAKARAWSSSRSASRTRYYDVGIAEQHAVTFAAGLACEGLKPVVAIYSTFLQRAYDQLIHDVAIQNLPVVFALDRAGLVGADGATHAGAYDIAYLRCIPNMSVADAGRRERVPAGAVPPPSSRTIRSRCAIRAAPAPASRSQPGLDALPYRQGRDRGAQGEAHRDPRLRHAAVPGAGGGRASSTPRWPTCASSSRSTSSCVLQLARSARRARHGGRGRVMGGAGSAVLEALAAARHRASRCCSSACPTDSSSTATRPSCWPRSGSMRRASSVDPRSASARPGSRAGGEKYLSHALGMNERRCGAAFFRGRRRVCGYTRLCAITRRVRRARVQPADAHSRRTPNRPGRHIW